MALVRNTSSCHDDHLCQTIFKSHHLRLSYGPDTILEHTNTHGQGKLCMSFRHYMAEHKNLGGIMVLVLSTLSDNALYLYQVLSKYLIGFQRYGPEQ